MTDKVASPDGAALSKGLGPLPETDVWAIGSLDAREDVYAYSAEATEAERRRCYALGVAAESERWKAMLLAAAREAYAYGRDGKDVTVKCDDNGWRLEWKA